MINKKEKDWFKLKRYPHIGLPLQNADRFKWIENYVTNPSKIATHSFLPFIHKTSKVRKFRKEYSKDDGKVLLTENKALRKSAIKKRELYYASHLDSLIFSYYSKLISDEYDKLLKKNGLDESILAYRTIPKNKNLTEGSNKCNIDFANDVFKYIKEYNKDEFVVIAFDIKSFFDNLDHKILREIWAKVFGVKELSKAHFNVFKGITRFSYVDIVDIFEEFKDNILIQKRDFRGNLMPIKKGRISKIKHLKNHNAIAFCTQKEFLKVKNKLLKNTKSIKTDTGVVFKRNFGIPQGSPISSVLANAYMIDFDKTINDYISETGIYRRYSDDMVVVCPKEEKDNIINLMNREIEQIKLEIQEPKTQIFHFRRENNNLICGQEFKKEINWHKNFMYLGFEFDGSSVLLKSASLSTFYRKMKRTIKRSKHFAKKGKNKGQIFKGRVLKKYSYKGASRKRKWVWNETILGFEKSESYDWGNFLSYSNKAAKVMNENKINKQTKKSWNKLIKEIALKTNSK
ncbi:MULTISPECIES: reverse transcriptase domain-containing protein [Bizionia]|uniref:reverse transcriptase domain-containing protein n=1 Tax=Bizionia TaxID=283785 RepID=UPI001FE8D76B|nr:MULTISPECIES: reverse transcriptase domain-containing protein [Bizionia]